LTALGTVAFIFWERAAIRTYWERLTKLHVVYGLLIFCVVVVPWYLAVSWATGGLFPKVFFLYENLARFAGHTNLVHGKWYHFLLATVYGFFPWVLFLAQGLLMSFHPAGFRRQFGSQLFSDERDDVAVQKALGFLACFSVAVLVFFSCSGTQLDTYLLPAIAPMSIVVAVYLQRTIEAGESSLSDRRDKWLGLVSYLLVALGFAALLAGIFTVRQPFPSGIKYGVIACGAVLAAGYLMQSWFFRQRRYSTMLTCLVLSTLLAAAIGSQIGFRLLDRLGQRDLREICLSLANSRDQIAIFQAFKPSIMFYCHKPVDSFFHGSQLLSADKIETIGVPKKRQLIITSERTTPGLKAVPGLDLKLCDKRGQWSLWQANNVRLEKVQLLEDMFKNPLAFERAVSGDGDWGPLTVPYAGGDPHFWQKAEN
jgi:4-amino-4-deoxy-L-arabinose transferase-like glycosyltransferase